MSNFSRLQTALVLSAIVAVSPMRASAQATMTFNPGACATGYAEGRGSSYSESGFALTNSSGTFASWCGDAPHYGGNAIFINNGGGNGSLSKIGGGTFSIQSIDLTHVYAGAYDAQSFTFTGNVFGGGTVSEIFTIAAQTGTPSFATFAFDPSFTNLTSLDLAQQDPTYYQFTNVKLDSVTATPEPASIALVATGFVGLFGVARRKKNV